MLAYVIHRGRGEILGTGWLVRLAQIAELQVQQEILTEYKNKEGEPSKMSESNFEPPHVCVRTCTHACMHTCTPTHANTYMNICHTRMYAKKILDPYIFIS